MNRVFVSYSRRNKTFAERIARDLDDAGMVVWVDWRQIQAGEFWQEEIFRGLELSDIIVACLSPDAVKSEWVQREINTGREAGKIILPIMAVEAYTELNQTESLKWLLDRHWIHFEGRYQEAFQELLESLPGKRRVGAYDRVDTSNIPNPFKGLEAFQQTDSQFFFGRERLIEKSLSRLRLDRPTRFLGIVGASGSGKSSLVRAGVIPELRRGEVIPGSEEWRTAIFTPGASPVDALAARLSPFVEAYDAEQISDMFHDSVETIDRLADAEFVNTPDAARLLVVVDQFEELFTRAAETERELFIRLIHHAATRPNGRIIILVTMRADFFDRVGRYPDLAALFEQENMVIVTEMTAPELLRTIEGPAEAVGLEYDRGLSQRILDEVRRQPGSLPLLQYALKELYERREGRRLTTRAYEQIGGVRQALASHAENIYQTLNPAEQSLMRRILLRLVSVSDEGEATRRKIARADLRFSDVSDEAVQSLVDRLTSASSRLLIASREIKSSSDETEPTIWIEVSHEALIREWERFSGWISENLENLRYGSELLQSATDWRMSDQDTAYLLTGNRLKRAEIWLETADATQLQRDFIKASITEEERREADRQRQMERELELQQRASRRLRNFVIVLVAALIVAIALSGVTLNSLNAADAALLTAEFQRNRAEANANEANSLALSASANRALGDDDGELAVMLAVEASQIDNAPPQSQRVLAEVAYAPGARRLIAHEHAVRAVAFSPDGQTALTASDTQLFLWNLTTGEVIREFTGGHDDTINSLDFNADGTQAVSGGDDGRVIVWDVTTGAIIADFLDHTEAVNKVVFSPAVSQVASGGDDNVVYIRDIPSQQVFRVFQFHTNAVNALAYSGDGRLLASGADDGTIRVMSIANGSIYNTLPAEPAAQQSVLDFRITALAFDPTDNDLLASGSDDNIVRLWDVTSANEVMILEAHNNPVTDIVYAAGGSTFFSAASDASIILWRESTGEALTVFEGHDSAVFDIDFSPDRSRLISGSFDNTLRLWDIERAEELRRYSGHRGRSTSTFGVYGPGDRTVLSGAYDNTLRLWDVTTQLTIQEFLGHQDRVASVAISTDGTTALSASWDDTVILWDVANGTPIHVLADHASDVQAVAYLPDNQRAISGASNGGIILWNLESGTVIRQYGPAVEKDDPGHVGPVYDIATHDNRVLSASADSTLILWDMDSGEVIATLDEHNAAVRAVAFNAAGTRAVSGGSSGDVLLWNVDEADPNFGQVIQRLEGHDLAVFDVAFAPNRDVIASVALDGTIRLWDVSSGFEIRRYDTGSARVLSVDFSQDGAKLLTGMLSLIHI